MRWLRALTWGVTGALPGVILFALPGFVESQRENLGMILGGLAWGVVGLWIGLWAGWHEDPVKRRFIALGATAGAVVGAVLFFGVSLLLPESPGGLGIAAFAMGPIFGSFMGSRARSHEESLERSG